MYHKWHKFAKTMYVVEVSSQVMVQSDLDHKSEFTSYSVSTRSCMLGVVPMPC